LYLILESSSTYYAPNHLHIVHIVEESGSIVSQLNYITNIV